MKLKIFFISLMIFSSLFAQEDSWAIGASPKVTGIGKSMDQETAFRLACQNALKAYLEEVLPRESFKKAEKEIEKCISFFYKRYFVEKPEIKLWDGWTMQIAGKVKKELLLGEIQYRINIPEVKGKVAILEWDEGLSKLPEEHAQEWKKKVQSQLEQTLKQYGMEFSTSEKIQKELEREYKESGTFASEQEAIYLEHSKSHFQIKTGLIVRQVQQDVMGKEMTYWDVKVSIEIYPQREKNRIFHGIFPPENTTYGMKWIPSKSESHLIGSELVSKVSRHASDKVASYLRDYRPVSKSHFIVYFSGFDKEAKLKIIKSFDALLAKQQILDMKKGIGGGGTLKIEFQSHSKINVLQEQIVTSCIEEGIAVMLDPTRQDDLGQTFYYISKETTENW